MRSAFTLLAVAAALAGCGGENGDEDGYPQEAVETFVTECRKQPDVSENACRCMIERLQVVMPYEEFERADRALEEGRDPAEASLVKLQAAADRCR